MPDSYTKLLLHCDGSDASTSVPDASASNHTITCEADAQLDTAQKVFGPSSLLFDGTGDYAWAADHADWNFGSDVFTIDFRVRFNALNTGYNGLIDQFYLSRAWAISYYHGAPGNTLYFNWSIDGSNVHGSGVSWSPSVDTWYHIAIVRTSATVIKLFVDGTQIGGDLNANSETFYDSTEELWLGCSHGGGDGQTPSNLFSGWLDEIRISKGIARWTSNFTPPASAYSDGFMTLNTGYWGQ